MFITQQNSNQTNLEKLFTWISLRNNTVKAYVVVTDFNDNSKKDIFQVNTIGIVPPLALLFHLILIAHKQYIVKQIHLPNPEHKVIVSIKILGEGGIGPEGPQRTSRNFGGASFDYTFNTNISSPNTDGTIARELLDLLH